LAKVITSTGYNHEFKREENTADRFGVAAHSLRPLSEAACLLSRPGLPQRLYYWAEKLLWPKTAALWKAL